METQTVKSKAAKVTVNDEVARKTRNFVKNLRRDVVKAQAKQSAETSSKYDKRMALAEKVALQFVVTALEVLLADKPTSKAVAVGVANLVTVLEGKVAVLAASRTNPDASKYRKRRDKGEEIATANVLKRLEKLQG